MILFRRLGYMAVLRTRLVWSDRLARNVWVRCDPYLERRERKHLHVFLEDGTDGIGQRWKSVCGRYYHEVAQNTNPSDVATWIKSFLEASNRCSICCRWLEKNKEFLLVAEHMAAGLPERPEGG